MKQCTFCGKSIEESSSFCPECGAKQLDASIAIKADESEKNESSFTIKKVQENSTSFNENNAFGPAGGFGSNNNPYGNPYNQNNNMNNSPYGNNPYGNNNPYGMPQMNDPYNQGNPYSHLRLDGVQRRDLISAVILCIVTCGIYTLFWIASLNDELNYITDDNTSPSGGTVILLSFVTCGLYLFYWLYKMGEKVDYIKGRYEHTGLLYAGLGLFQLSIVSFALMQDVINNVIDESRMY